MSVKNNMIIKIIKRILIVLLWNVKKAVFFVFVVMDNIRGVIWNIFYRKQEDIVLNFLDKNKKNAIFFSTIPFDVMVQRPQQLCKAFYDKYGKDYNVVYINIPFLKLIPNIQVVDWYNILQINSFSFLVKILKKKWIINIDFVYYYYVFYNNFINKFKNLFKVNNLVYDYLDDISISEIDIEEEHIEALQLADKVSTTADKLKAQIMQYRQDVIYIPNGVNINDWEIEDKNKLLQVKKEYNLSQNIIWFYGAIEDWIDFDILELILQNKNYTLVIIWIDNKDLLNKKWILKYENAIYLWYKSYGELKYYANLFSIAIIPFKINKLTDGVSPVKFFEYLIQWKPVVTTWFYEIKKHNQYCFVSNNKDDFLQKINIAIEKSKSQEYVKSIKEYWKNYDWNKLIEYIK